MRKLIICLVVLLTITGCAKDSVKEAISLNSKTVTSSEASSLIKDGAILVDVRTKEEYDEKHITGAVNIPLSEIEDGNIEYDKNTAIIVYCRSGNRSSSAAKKLIALGYTNVYDLGSINNWKETE
jgi:rhodanese-related sulfurtransferase